MELYKNQLRWTMQGAWYNANYNIYNKQLSEAKCTNAKTQWHMNTRRSVCQRKKGWKQWYKYANNNWNNGEAGNTKTSYSMHATWLDHKYNTAQIQHSTKVKTTKAVHKWPGYNMNYAMQMLTLMNVYDSNKRQHHIIQLQQWPKVYKM